MSKRWRTKSHDCIPQLKTWICLETYNSCWKQRMLKIFLEVFFFDCWWPTLFFFALFWLNLELYRIQNLAWFQATAGLAPSMIWIRIIGFLPFCTVRMGSPASWLVTLRILKLQMHWHHPLLQRNRETHENNCINCSTEIKCHSCK